jgi:hypothetical protein
MYIERIGLRNIRTFRGDTLTFIHPDKVFRVPGEPPDLHQHRLPKPILPNVNLLLGEIGSGKTTVLQAIALSSLGPVAAIARLPVPRLVRMSDDSSGADTTADLMARFFLHPQDAERDRGRNLHLRLQRRGELEELQMRQAPSAGLSDEPSPDELKEAQQRLVRSLDARHLLEKQLQHFGFTADHQPEQRAYRQQFSKLKTTFDEIRNDESREWKGIHESGNPAFFCVAYGATRRTDPGGSRSPATGPVRPFLRGARIQSIFDDGFSLCSLRSWLPALRSEDPNRFTEILSIINSLLRTEHCRLTEEERDGEPLFECHGLKMPLTALSEGDSAFLPWVADLLYHMSRACPPEQSLLDCRGIVLVDEIELHLHPRWQMKLVGTIATAFPKLQFIFTSHSPLIVGSVEWMNILKLQAAPATNATDAQKARYSLHGLDADQMMLSTFFGLESTRGALTQQEIAQLEARIAAGDWSAALQLGYAMSSRPEVND